MQNDRKSTNIYGAIVDYLTGDVLRVATREDWLYARLVGDADTGAHRGLDDALTVFCDGPEADADPEPYGRIVDYLTGDVLRVATREDWLYAHEVGEAHTGAHRDRTPTTDALTVFCDGPDADADPACPPPGPPGPRRPPPWAVDQIAAITRKLRLGEDMGPVISQAAVDRIHRYIDQAEQLAAKVIVDGGAHRMALRMARGTAARSRP